MQSITASTWCTLGTRRASIAMLVVAALLGTALVGTALTSTAFGQKGKKEDLGPLFQQPAFDQIVLKSGEKMKTRSIRFKDGSRNIPLPYPAAGVLVVRPYESKTTATYDVPWSGIAQINLFEDLILQQAQQLTKAKKFDEAFGFYSYLLQRAPKTRNLEASINRYLQSNASVAYQAGEFDRALAILGSLYDRNPKAAHLATAVDTIAGKIIENYLKDRDYRSARMTLDVVEQNFRGLQITIVKKQRGRFEKAAKQQLAEALRFTDAHQYLAARQSVSQAIGVWPEIEGALKLQARIQREHPVVRIGVTDRAPRDAVDRIDSWASSRASVLMHPTLVELRDYSSEGGVYQSTVARITLDDSAMGLTIELSPPPTGNLLSTSLGVSAITRRLMEEANPQHPLYRQVLGDLIDKVYADYPKQVRVTFTHPHVRPEALLTMPMPLELFPASDRGLYGVAEYNDNIERFMVQDSQHTAIAEIHEVPMDNDDDAIMALLHGTVDIIDRVPPWQLSRLRAAKGVKVDSYRLPTIHALIPTGRNSLTQRREFRRALCYGLDRQKIVRQVLLGGKSIPGYQVVSGPFPAGTGIDDPIRYGYNRLIKPRAYDPYMAIILATTAWTSAQKMKGIKEPSEELPTLLLGHSNDPVARTACLEISKALNALKIPIKLVEMSAAELLQADDKVDLKYVELSVWQPAIDARRLLGSDGLTGETSDYMAVALDLLEGTRSRTEATARLFEIHSLAHSDLSIIPLWQTINYFAYRNSVSGLSERPVRLYQDIGQWQIEFGSERL